MTTVVFPDAPVKIYLTADLPTRAQRRFREYEEKGVPVDYESLKEQIRDRDEADRSRETAPLTLAPDAFYLDTSHLPFEEVVRRVLCFISQKSQNCQK
jgi:cytidylate kinase